MAGEERHPRAIELDEELRELARECEYTDGAGFPDENPDYGDTIDGLIEYKDALEERLYDAEVKLADATAEPPVLAKAREIARLLHDEGLTPTEAVTRVGIDPEEVYSEDSSVFDLDERDNDLIDLCWHEHLWVGVRRIDGVWTVETTRRET